MTATWTDDLRVCVARGETLVSLVDYVLASAQAPWAERLEVLTTRFALSFDDARLAIDRVDGGRVRAANPAHEPDRGKDPIAWIAYRRLRREAVPAEVSAPSAEEEQAATAQWRAALEGDEADATTSVGIALQLVELAARTMAEEPDRNRRGRVVLRAAHALSDAAEACIEAQGGDCAGEGTQAWADAVRMGIGARQLATWFAALGAGDLEGIALNLQGRIVTRLLGQCHAHVGRVMLDGVDWSLRSGDTAKAIRSCQAVVGDFAALVDEWEADEDAPFDEHRQALGHLLAALEVLASLDQTVDGELRARCLAQLARPPTR
jgi:hypothetical protein